MIWLGAVLVSAALEPDPLADYEGCTAGCTLCLDACPQKALDGSTIDQRLCRERSNACTDGGGCVLACNACRKACPHRGGLNKGNNAIARRLQEIM